MPKTEIIESTLYGGAVKVKFYPNSHRYLVQVGDAEESGVKGVTTILGIKDKSAPLVSWATELARDYLLEKIQNAEAILPEDIVTACRLHAVRKEEAATIGSKIHDWCERYIKYKIGGHGELFSEMPPIPDEVPVQRGISAFLDWEHEHKVVFVSSERMVYSRTHHYIGTMDIEAIIDGKLALVDLKSSNGLYNAVRMQTAAYAMADMEEYPDKKYETRWAIRLSKEAEEEYHERMQKRGRAYPPYLVFEAMEFPTDMDTDFDAFLATKKLYDWNCATDFYLNRVTK